MGGGNVSQDQTSIICIDLKSFYASVECVERGLDPFKANLVVADPTRSKSTICLAITPAMKSLGIKNRCRIHEIPDCVKYITAMPRMQLYMDYSAKIYGIYLRYVSKEDIHVYSVDECFIDVTNYLQLYHLTAKEMAVKLMQEVMEETGITATAGVGTNLYLAKIAMDIVAKHVDDHIGILDEFSYREQLWDHKPLSDFWRIGSRTEKKLAGYGIHTMGDIAMASLRSEDWLYKMFGIDAELLIDHAWGYETCRMSDIKNYHSEEHSLSNGQVLMRNYSFDEALVIVREMTDNLVLDLFEKGLVTSSLTLWIAYDHRYEHEASKGTVKLERESNSSKKIIDAVEDLYLRIADRYTGIRRIEVCANRVAPESYVQYSLFDDPKQTDKERHLQEAVWSGGPTASGAYPTANHTIAVDASNPFVPIGTKVVMNGVEYTVEDTGAFARYGVQFDVYYDNHAAASAHGHQTWEAYIADDNGSQEVTVTSTSTKKILYVTLTNGSFDAVARANLNAEQLIIYNALNTTYGNRNYLWDVNNVTSGSGGNGMSYEIPPEALQDEEFARMIREAEKYLGVPYVWGGYSPSGFDCSGFVSYVINHCGNGWNYGRLTADGLRGVCTYVSPQEAKPGDLIFFQGTYNTSGASHVGIYVGNNMMIHCGDPIHYSSISTSYWQQHFMCFGRLP